jgi:hypothetical protein
MKVIHRRRGSQSSDVANQLPELVDVFEAAVHRGEAHVGDLVDAAYTEP